MKNFICSMILVSVLALSANAASTKNIKLSNKLFSITLPQKAKGLYSVNKRDNGIFIYDKKSKKAGFGGFAFGIQAYKNPADHAMMPGGRKIGELTDKHKTVYDVVLVQPTDVQYDYVKGDAETYKVLYDLADDIDRKISGANKSHFCKECGTKGENMYKDILKKHKKAIEEKWDSVRLENENMSYMYNVLAQDGTNVLDKVGYAYYDANGDGIDELVIGEIADGSWKGVVYDLYTMVDRKPKHVTSGGSRNRYYMCNGAFICNEYSSGAAESGCRVTILVENSTELFPQIHFKYDGYENAKSPWYYAYSDNKWENVSEQKYKERKATFEKYVRFDYTPLSKFK